MAKAALLLAFALSLLTLFFALSASQTAAQQQGCCVNPASGLFCSQTQVNATDCCGTDVTCLANFFYAGQSCAATGLCLYDVADGCCPSRCASAKILGVVSPIACWPNTAEFQPISCSAFAECAVGCAFCEGDVASRGRMTLASAQDLCAGFTKSVSYFDTTVTDCTLLSQPKTEFFSISGKVTDQDKNAISGATVTAAWASTTTDQNGEYNLAKVPRGNYTLSAIAPGFLPNWTSLSIATNLTGINFTLSRRPDTANITVNVTNGTRGPVAGATVQLFNASATPQTLFRTGITDSSGIARFTGIPITTSYNVSASFAGLINSSIVDVTEVIEYIVNLTLPIAAIEPGNLSGWVLNETGQAVGGTKLTVAGRVTYSDATGFYRFVDLTPGSYSALIEPPSPYLAKTELVSVQPATEVEQNFSVSRVVLALANLTIFANYSIGPGVSGASLSIRPVTAALPVISTTFDYSYMATLTPGQSYEIRLSQPGWSTVLDVIFLNESMNRSYVLSPAVRYSLSGSVLDEKGLPVAGALVYLEDPITGLLAVPATISGIDGGYTMIEISAGSYRVVAAKPGFLDDRRDLVLDADKIVDLMLRTRACFAELLPPNITAIRPSLNKLLATIEFVPACDYSHAFVWRCEDKLPGQPCTDFKPISNALPNTNWSFVDSALKPNSTYRYMVQSWHTSPWVQFKNSSVVEFRTGDEPCYTFVGEFCWNNTRTKCAANNSMIVIEPASPLVVAVPPVGNRSYAPLCRYKSAGKTEYVRDLDCERFCGEPLGLFGQPALAQLPIPRLVGTTLIGFDFVACGSGYDPTVGVPELYGCYRDRGSTHINAWQNCSEIASCYDYQSPEACTANRCRKDLECEWKDSPKFSSLGIGLCRPKSPKQLNCSACSNAVWNKLFGQCTPERCELIGNYTNESHCFFDWSLGLAGSLVPRCRSADKLSCRDYGESKADCLGPEGRAIELDPANNAIVKTSGDLLRLGHCDFDASSGLGVGSCFKDSNDDRIADNWLYQDDMSPPFSVVLHPPASRVLDFPIYVYDDRAKNVTVAPAETRFAIGITPPGPAKLYPLTATDGRMAVPAVLEGNWSVFYYSEDLANNLEVVKSFDITIDTTPPNITANYTKDFAGNVQVSLSATEWVRCNAALIAEKDGKPVQKANSLSENTSGLFNSTVVRNYKNLPDGLYLWRWSCKDWVGNVAQDELPILVDRDAVIYDLVPDNQKLNYNEGIVLSVKTLTDAECRYYNAPLNQSSIDGSREFFNNMTLFAVTGGRSHSSTLNFPGVDNQSYRFFVRCRVLATDELTISLVKAIKFTIDRLPPATYAVIPEDVAAIVLYNFSRWTNRAYFRLRCVDPDIPGIPGEFGCKGIFWCSTLEASCTPTRSSGAPLIIDSTTHGERYCYYSVDHGNNVGSTNCTPPFRIDSAPPTPTITAITPNPKGARVNSTAITLSGAVNNYAFWAESATEDIGWYSDYTLSATVSSLTRAELRYDWIDERTFSFVTLDFENDRVYADGVDAFVELEPGSPAKISIKTSTDTISITVNNVSLNLIRARPAGRIKIVSGNWSSVAISPKDAAATISPIVRIEYGLENATIRLCSNAEECENYTRGFNGTVDLLNLIAIPDRTGNLVVDAWDEAGNVGRAQQQIVLDIEGPALPPIFDPSLVSGYESLDYPLYFDIIERLFWTNDPNLFVSGSTPEPEERLEFFVNGELNKNYSQPPVRAWNFAPFRTAFSAAPGESCVRASGDLTPFRDRIVAEGGQIEYYLGFGSHHRKSYGAFKAYYPIANESYNSATGYHEICLGVPLEEAVPQFDNFTVYNSSLAPDRFGLALSLADDHSGRSPNTFFINQYDDLGNPGAPTDTITIIVDSIEANITSASPPLDYNRAASDATKNVWTKFNWSIPALSDITLVIEDIGGGLIKETAELEINGIELRPVVNESVDATNPLHKSYLVRWVQAFPDGRYEIFFRIKEKGGKAVVARWDLNVDGELPLYPEITVLNDAVVGIAPDGFTFVNGSPQLLVRYLDDEFVQLVGEYVTDLAGSPVGVGIDCARAVPTESYNTTPPFDNSYYCNITGINASLDRDYVLHLPSQKVYSDGSAPRDLYDHLWFFATDPSPPAITAFELTERVIKPTAPISFSLAIPNERHPLLATANITNIDSPTNSVELSNLSLWAVGGVYSGTIGADALRRAGLTLRDGQNYSIWLNVSDYAGNSNVSDSKNLSIDGRAPMFVNVTIRAIPIFIVMVNETELRYVVREDKITVNGSVDNDTVLIEFVRGNDNKLVGGIVPCKEGAARTNCIAPDGSFSFTKSAIIMGRPGAMVWNTLFLIATDAAGNMRVEEKSVLRDIAKPGVRRVCVEAICEEIPEAAIEIITDPAQMRSICMVDRAQELNCYDTMIRAACKDSASPSACYKDYVVQLSAFADPLMLYRLCSNSYLLKDQCLNELAVASGLRGLCALIGDELLRLDCYARTR